MKRGLFEVDQGFGVFGYDYDSSWGEERTDLLVTDSLRTAENQPRRISLRPIQKNPARTYPAHVMFNVDGDDTTYLDAAIFFIPQNRRAEPAPRR